TKPFALELLPLSSAQTLALLWFKSVRLLVTSKTSERPDCNVRLVVVSEVPAKVISPPATSRTFVSVLVIDVSLNEPTPLEMTPPLWKLVTQICEPWSDSKPLLIIEP